MGGFECTDQQNAFGYRVDLTSQTAHDRFLNEDYAKLDGLKIKTVREGIRWSQVEKKAYNYDWSSVDYFIKTAAKHNIQIVWDICHFGFPDDLTPLHPMFARRFAHVCEHFVRHYRELVPDGPLIVTPINEVSFLSWLGGDVRGTSPYTINLGWEVKYHLMKAYIEGIERMKMVDPAIRIMTTEPLINVSPGFTDHSEIILKAQSQHNAQYEVLEILSGRLCPELRGRPEYVDIIGINFYYNNQWISEPYETLPWGDNPPHPLWRPLSDLVNEVFLKYGRPIVVSETSHPGEDRPAWIRAVGDECNKILNQNIPLWGCCIYPLIDRPDWDHQDIWHKSGIWDIFDTDTLHRVVHQETYQAVKTALPE